jgi:MOSC N-terminal beta barrel domain
MSQKQFPRMALTRPVIDEGQGVMRVRAEGMRELVISLDLAAENDDGDDGMDVRVCGDIVRSYRPSVEASTALHPVLCYSPTSHHWFLSRNHLSIPSISGPL